jgi:hypothetical protein
MAHPPPRGGRLSCDEGDHRFCDLPLDKLRCFLFRRPADLAVCGSFSNNSRISMKPEPTIGSPPIPMEVDWPIPRPVNCQIIS